MMKRLFDILLASVGLLGSAPLWALIALAIKIEDGGPVLFFQERVGRHGRTFRAFKFRSMVADAEARTGAIQAATDDPRVTRTGRLLRATAFDELPQLVNILRGELSVVGPRPLRPGEVDTTAEHFVRLDAIPGYMERHLVRPGLTGLAQVHAARDVSRDEKFRYDLEYVRTANSWLDIKLIVLSFWISFRGRWEQREPKI
jgi:lipopolysaccharide/colanic/teichoic acid biosynthesis glycosyltransferase